MDDEWWTDTMRRSARLRDFELALERASSIGERCKIVRQIYSEAMPWLLEANQRGTGADPYFIDWIRRFTPIEDDAWQSIRGQGLPMYPQVPALHYFIDFADPFKKIGLEVDGKEWHADKAKDLKRDDALVEAGWKIFRVTGSEAHASPLPPWELRARGKSDEDVEFGTRDWLFHSVDGVVAAIHRVYYRGTPDEFNGGLLRTLSLHRLAQFDL